jgi:iron complex outermembrane receptor protein
MSELHNSSNAANIRQTLLATVSALVLVAAVPEAALAAGKDRPTVWIEGGWHFESITGDADTFAPPLDASTVASGFPSLTAVENELGRTYGAEGSISFQPHGSDWVFTASARYGRTRTTRRLINQKTIVGPQLKQTTFQSGGLVVVPVTPTFPAYATHNIKNYESHAIADFQVGKDVGIGLLGRGTDTVISFGARYAQMNASSKGNSFADPNAVFEQAKLPIGPKYFYYVRALHHASAASMERSDSLHALGPSLSLKNTTGLLGTVDDGQIALDWGVNAALLFGRQKAKTSHHSTVRYFAGVSGTAIQSVHTYAPVTRTRSRMVTVPNVGGFAGLSYRFTNAKISAGYRADFFFGAKDSGLETRSTADVVFHGPFATISIVLGG